MVSPVRKLKILFIILGVSGAVYGVFRFLLPLAAPFLAAWGMAVLLRPSSEWVSAHIRLRILRPQFFVRILSRFQRQKDSDAIVLKLGLSAGAAGAAEMLLILAAVSGALVWGGRMFFQELMNLIDRLPALLDTADVLLTDWCHRLECGFHLRENHLVLLARKMILSLAQTIKKGAMPYIMANSVSVMKYSGRIMVFLLLTVISTGMLIQEFDRWQQRIRRSVFCTELTLIISRIALVVGAYLKTQGILFLIISSLCTATFYFLGNSYFILAGIGTGLLDALPVFGTGTVLVPWAAVLFFSGRWKKAVILLILYAVCYVLREYLESRWMGSHVGLSPLENLMSIFVGLQLLGLPGLILGPLALLLIRDLSIYLIRSGSSSNVS